MTIWVRPERQTDVYIRRLIGCTNCWTKKGLLKTLSSTLRVYTARISYSGNDRLNITRKANDPVGMAFAPSWDLLRSFLRLRREGKLTDSAWLQYRAHYTNEMQTSYENHRAIWCRVLDRKTVTFVCFCTNAAQCHRTILAELFRTLGAGVIGERDVESRKSITGLLEVP